MCSIFIPLIADAERTRKLALDELDFGETIGSGQFGTVMRATLLTREVAVKILPVKDDFEQERAVLSAIPPHPNLVEFVGATLVIMVFFVFLLLLLLLLLFSKIILGCFFLFKKTKISILIKFEKYI